MAGGQLLLLLAAAAILACWFLRDELPLLQSPQTAHVPNQAQAVNGSRLDEKPVAANRQPIQVLYPGPGDASEIEVDIIAVHGLGAHVDRSWTWRDKTGRTPPVNWLSDAAMLPDVVPKARIMAYSYDSRWHANSPKTRLQLCGEDLIHSLHSFRDGVGDRPVIFIGHSLGGLVIQHALLYADRVEALRYLPRCTVGFVALGSPFRGTKMQGLADWAAQLLVLANSHRGIIRDLAFDAPSLRDRMQEFCRLRDMLSIPACCFFELYRTDYGKKFGIPGLFRGMVVGEESACVPGWDRFPLQTDHSMNKFSGSRDPSFLRVSDQLRKMCTSSRAVMQSRKNLTQGYWTVPFGYNKDFVGRDPILDWLLARIPPGADPDNCQRTVVEGLGGVGKTQIALMAAFRVHRAHPDCSVFWVPAINATSFENAYLKIGQKLDIKGINDDKADIKSLIKAALSSDSVGNWLLVIDNADDTELLFGTEDASHATLFEYLPFHRNGSILFTTRNHQVTAKLDVPMQDVKRTAEMSEAEAAELLQKNLSKSQVEPESMTDLLDFLTYLPLAIKQASAYMSKTGMSTIKYLDHCRSSDTRLTKLLAKDFEDRYRYKEIENPVATTWLISFNHISRHDPLAARYLRFMCFFAEKEIPISLLPPAIDELEADEAIGTLKAYAFITQRDGEDSFDIHRLIRLATRIWIDQEGEQKEYATEAISRLEELFPFPKHENRDVWMGYLPHAIAVLDFRNESYDKNDVGDLLFKVGKSDWIVGKYKEAKEMYRQLLGVREKVLGEEHLDTLGCINDLAVILELLGEYDEAKEMHQHVLGVWEKVLGKEHPNTLISKSNLAIVFYDLQKYDEAKEIHQQASRSREKVLGKEHPQTLKSKSNLAIVLSSLQKYDEAKEIHQQVLGVQEKVLGKEHPDTLISKSNLANCLSAMEELRKIESQ